MGPFPLWGLWAPRRQRAHLQIFRGPAVKFTRKDQVSSQFWTHIMCDMLLIHSTNMITKDWCNNVINSSKSSQALSSPLTNAHVAKKKKLCFFRLMISPCGAINDASTPSASFLRPLRRRWHLCQPLLSLLEDLEAHLGAVESHGSLEMRNALGPWDHLSWVSENPWKVDLSEKKMMIWILGWSYFLDNHNF